MLRQHNVTYKKKQRGSMSLRTTVTLLNMSLALNVFLGMSFLYCFVYQPLANDNPSSVPLKSIEQTWHGGHPSSKKSGSCWCGGEDHYCMCTPSLAIDLIIATADDHVWLVRRKDTNQLATMGGFVEVGETLEDAVLRELKEEMGIYLVDKKQMILVGIYSDPRRDNRRHTTSAAFAVEVRDVIHPRAGDDAKGVVQIPLNDIENHSFFADHKTILMDYRQSKMGKRKDDFTSDITRSLCNRL